MEKQKESYKAVEVELILFEFSDIVTASSTDTGNGFVDNDPNDWGNWT